MFAMPFFNINDCNAAGCKQTRRYIEKNNQILLWKAIKPTYYISIFKSHLYDRKFYQTF